jgi:hypothetical protein
MIEARDVDVARYSHIKDIYRRVFAGCITGMDEGIRNISEVSLHVPSDANFIRL